MALREEARYLTDDRDYPPHERYELVIFQGENGDWYVSVVQEGQKSWHAVRISTSGGASSAAPGLPLAIARVYEVIAKARKP